MTKATLIDIATVPGIEWLPSYNYGNGEHRLNDRDLYGRTTDVQRARMSRWIHADAAAEGDHGAAHRREAESYGRAAYNYACGWYDALKDDRPGYWRDRVLTLAWTFGEECEFADYAFRREVTAGGRYGFGYAWEIVRGVHLLG